MEEKVKNDFTEGSVINNIIKLAIPMTLAQIVNVLYNVIDRVYIGRIPENSTFALTGLGICFPIITMVIAFANLVGMGGAPLFSIERGRKNKREAEYILGNSFCLLIILGLLLSTIFMIFKRPLLYLLGASDATFYYANSYISIYLLGSIFVMISLGLNSFINAEGFGKIGMATVMIGAVVNLILDPIFIFKFNMGVRGAALATVISQFLSAIWTVYFLTGKNAVLKLRKITMRLEFKRVKRILTLGLAGFTMSVTNSIVQMVCNANLKIYGGDIYIGIMTVINSIREIVHMPISGLTSGAQPIMGFNYGAMEYERVKKSIRFLSVSLITYTLIAWALVYFFPEFFIKMFNHDNELISKGIKAIHVYFFGFFMMALQFIGQSVFTALGRAKKAIFFSIFRKVIIVVPLTIILPKFMDLGVMGVFMAEPISNFIGGFCCFVTMIYTEYFKLKKE